MLITVANRSGLKQSNAYTTMRQLILLIAVFVKRLYVLTNIYVCHQLYAAVSRNHTPVKTYIQAHIVRSQSSIERRGAPILHTTQIDPFDQRGMFKANLTIHSVTITSERRPK
jgi:hypothetical protein